jgi:iron complex outermembrane receptor protein
MPTAGAAGYEYGPGELTEQPNRRVDLDVSLRRAMTDDWVLVGGFAAGRSELDRSTTRLAYWRDASTRTTVLNEGQGTYRNQALFLQSEHFLGHDVTAYLGARYDRFDTQGRVAQNTPPAFDQSYDSRSFDAVSPKLALVWQARPGWSLRTSWGAAFRPPTLSDLYSRSAVPTSEAGVISVNEPSPTLQPERVKAFEVGTDVAWGRGGLLTATLYRQRLTDLIYRRRLSPVLTRTENAGEASVDGIEAGVTVPLGTPGLSLFGSLTHQFTYEITRNDAVPASVGKRLTDVPETMGALGVQYRSERWSAMLAYRYVSHVFGSGDDLNQNVFEGVFGSYDAYGIVRARFAWRPIPQLELSLAVENATDRDYFVFYKQPGRTAFAEAAWRF